jgi:hypothetical protein
MPWAQVTQPCPHSNTFDIRYRGRVTEWASDIAELVGAVVLDDAIAEVTTAEAVAIATATNATRLQAISIARGESWRQLRARNIFPYDLRLVQAGTDPVSALTVIERTALALVGRLQLEVADAAFLFGVKPKQFERIFHKAKVQLIRATTAITLISGDSRCPAVVSGKHRFGTAMDRRKSMHFVAHAGECSICVPVLREIDHTIWDVYQAAEKMSYQPASAESADVAKIVARAKLKDGFSIALADDFRDQTKALKRAVWVGAVSSILLGLGLLLS